MMESKPSFESKRSVKPSSVGGIILVVLGVMFLADQFLAPDFLNSPIHLGTTIGAMFFFAVALAFLAGLVINPRRNWWMVFPAFPNAALGVAVLVEAKTGFSGLWAGPILFGGTSLAFLAVLAMRRDHYWPIIPAGVLISLAIQAHNPFNFDGTFLLGLSLTFLATFAYGLLTPRKATWALIPAAVLGAAGLGLNDFTSLSWAGPAFLILLGVVMLVRRIRN